MRAIRAQHVTRPCKRGANCGQLGCALQRQRTQSSDAGSTGACRDLFEALMQTVPGSCQAAAMHLPPLKRR